MSFFFPDSADSERRPGLPSRWRGLVWMSLGLVYLLIWPAADVFSHHQSTGRIIGSVLALVSFIGAFVATTLSNVPWQEGMSRTTQVLLGVIALMSVAYPIALGQEWVGLPIYLSVAAVMTLPSRRAPLGIAVATLLTLAVCTGEGAPGSTTALLTFQSFSIGMLMLAFRGSRLLVTELREARGEVARLAANEERLRIARDLHDLLGHSLSLIVLKSEVAARLADRDPGQSLQEVKDIESVARQALTDVRGAVSGYRQRSLSDELDNARDVFAAAAIELTVRTSGTPLPDVLDGLFGWAVREGVTNVVRHSRATTCRITVTYRAAVATLEVVDDGVGSPALENGNGLDGLTERVAEAGGEVEAATRPDGGFRLLVRAPATTAALKSPL
jgi:two-component system, NarL family, sensor histidine kinase DesK